MDALSREAILAAKDAQIEKVEIPQWKGCVWVRSLSGKEKDEFETSCLIIKGKKREVDTINFRAKLVAVSTVNEAGERLFTQDDILQISEKNGAALDLIFSVAQRLSGLGEKDVEELTKNSKPDQS